MAEPYLTELQSIIVRTGVVGNEAHSISCKHFFSGAAAYIEGHIFMSLSPIGLALKLSENDCNRLFEQGATPLRYFPKAPIKKGYAVLPSQLVDNHDTLQDWIKRSAVFARQQSV